MVLHVLSSMGSRNRFTWDIRKNILPVKVVKHKARCWGHFWRLLRTCLSSVHEEWQIQSWSCLQERGALGDLLAFSALFCRLSVRIKKPHTHLKTVSQSTYLHRDWLKAEKSFWCWHDCPLESLTCNLNLCKEKTWIFFSLPLLLVFAFPIPGSSSQPLPTHFAASPLFPFLTQA